MLTKSPLLLRDLDLLREIAEVTDIHANLSIPTMDEKPWRASEPHTPSPKARMEAVAELNRAGIPAGILVAPLMPGINDDPRQVERILEAAGEAGATGVSGIALHLRGEVRGIYMEWLRAYRPDLVPRYEALYARGPTRRARSRTGCAACSRRRTSERATSCRGGRPPTPAGCVARRPGGRRGATATGRGATAIGLFAVTVRAGPRAGRRMPSGRARGRGGRRRCSEPNPGVCDRHHTGNWKPGVGDGVAWETPRAKRDRAP